MINQDLRYVSSAFRRITTNLSVRSFTSVGNMSAVSVIKAFTTPRSVMVEKDLGPGQIVSREKIR
jgi:hypothetical protein